MSRLVALGIFALAACGSKTGKPLAAKGEAAVVARIDDLVITAQWLEAEINKLPPFARTRYSLPEQKKQYLENLVRFEVMAMAARARGYDRDPAVLRVLKQQMIDEFLRKEVDAKLRPEDIGDAEIEAFYREHIHEFTRPEEVRASQIFAKGRGTAEKAAAEAKALQRNDQAGFRALVEKYSEDEDSKSRGGDLTFFDRKTKAHPRPLVEAAFALKEIGEISPPIESEQGVHVLKLTQRRPGFVQPLAEAKRDAQRMILQARRNRKIQVLVAEMRQKIKVEVYDAELDKIVVEPPLASTPAGRP